MGDIRSVYFDAIKPKYHGYQELHTHTQASFRDAVTTVDEITGKALALGRNAFSITDHGNQMRLFHGIKARTKVEISALEKAMRTANIDSESIKAATKVIGPMDSIRNPTDKMWPFIEKYMDCYVDAVKHSLQFVPGIEMYFQPEKNGDDDSAYHLILYAMDWDGQKELFKLENLAQLNKTEGKAGQPGMARTTWADLERFCGPGTPGHGHIIATSACVGGYIPSLLLKPWKLTEKKQELMEKVERECGDVSEDELERSKRDVEEAKTMLANAKADLKFINKAEKTDFAKKVERQEKKVARLKERYQWDNAQISFMGTPSLGDEILELVQKEETTLAALVQNTERAKTMISKRAEYVRAVEQYETLLEGRKTVVQSVEKKLRPYQRYKDKIDALNEERKRVGDVEAQAKAAAIRMQEIFGKGYFYIELQNHGIVIEDVVRPMLYKIIQETGIPPTVANDVHFLNREDKHKRDIVCALRFNQPIHEVADKQGWSELYYKDNDEMNALFPDNIGQQGIENTSRIAEMCNVYYKKEMHLPEFDAKSAGYENSIKYLEAYAHKRIPEKYPINEMPPDKRTEMLDTIEKRLTYELDVIEKMGYGSYIAIVQDFIFYGRKIGGPAGIGPGRGSAAGSIVCYLTDITDIDPLRYKLLFERFLNPARVSMPDIDTDLAPSIRGKVIDYVAEKYSYQDEYPVQELRSTVCNIVTEGKLAARAAVRAVARVAEIPYSISDKVAKLIPPTPGITIQKAMKENAELAEMYNTDETIKQLVNDAMLVEGIPVQTGVHAAGVIIADKPVSEYAPLFYNDDAHCWVIECDMVSCEMDVGLLKMDFLGLKNLDIIKTAVFYTAKAERSKVDFNLLKQGDDTQVIQNIYGKGDTNGIFQFEGEGIKKALTGFKPTSIDDVILMNAAYRPGPMQFISDITAVKSGEREPNYIVPEMESILGNTYGSAIYQEQIQQIFNKIAGFSLGEADVIRRAMSKKHLDEITSAKTKFVEGFKKKGANDNDIEEFWNKLLEFAKYAFNKSHAAAYSIVSYYTAWLKEYHPCSFLAATMSYSSLNDIALYAADCKKRGIPILKPSLYDGVPNFAPTLDGKAIRYGLKTIKSVANAATSIYDARVKYGPIKDYREFVLRACVFGIGKDASLALILTGATDYMMTGTEHRKIYADNLAPATESCRKAMRKITAENPELTPAEVYAALNTDGEQYWNVPSLFVVEPYPQKEILDFERSYLGTYVSGNPIDPFMDLIQNSGRTQCIGETKEADQEAVIVGLVRDIAILHRKKDNAPFAKFNVEDETGVIETLLFTSRFQENRRELEEGAIVKINGVIQDDTISEDNVRRKLTVNQMSRIS